MGSASDWLMRVTGDGCDWLMVGGGRGCWVLSPLNTYKVQGSCRQSRELTLNCRLEPRTLSLSSAFTLILGRKQSNLDTRMWPLTNSVLVMVVSQTGPGFWRMMSNVLQASSSILVSGINISQKSSPGCPVCTDRNIFKEITKKTIKEEILRKLGLSSPPTVNVTVSTVSELPYVQQQINEVSKTDLNKNIPRENPLLDIMYSFEHLYKNIYNMLGWRAERKGGGRGLILNLSNTFQGEVFLDSKFTFFS